MGVNDDQPALEIFLAGYWNQMAPDLYASFDDALLDFRAMEGVSAYDRLLRELRARQVQDGFPRTSELRAAYSDPFWARYSLIVVREDVENSVLLGG